MNWLAQGLVAGMILTMPTLAQTNLIQNPDFAAGMNVPAQWKFESTAPETFEVRRAGAMELRSLGADSSGYLVQVVPVKPRTRYRLTVSLRQRGGRGLLWVNAKDAAKKPTTLDARQYVISFVGHPLVPRFVAKELMHGSDTDDWREQQLEFVTQSTDTNAAPIAFAKINIGCYFSVSQLWVRHVALIQLE